MDRQSIPLRNGEGSLSISRPRAWALGIGVQAGGVCSGDAGVLLIVAKGKALHSDEVERNLQEDDQETGDTGNFHVLGALTLGRILNLFKPEKKVIDIIGKYSQNALREKYKSGRIRSTNITTMKEIKSQRLTFLNSQITAETEMILKRVMEIRTQ